MAIANLTLILLIYLIKMKLALASLFFAAPAMAFAPVGSFGINSALKMSTETSEEKVRIIPWTGWFVISNNGSKASLVG